MSLRSVGSRRLAVVNGISGFGVADGGGGSWIQAQVFKIPGWEEIAQREKTRMVSQYDTSIDRQI